MENFVLNLRHLNSKTICQVLTQDLKPFEDNRLYVKRVNASLSRDWERHFLLLKHLQTLAVMKEVATPLNKKIILSCKALFEWIVSCFVTKK